MAEGWCMTVDVHCIHIWSFRVYRHITALSPLMLLERTSVCTSARNGNPLQSLRSLCIAAKSSAPGSPDFEQRRTTAEEVFKHKAKVIMNTVGISPSIPTTPSDNWRLMSRPNALIQLSPLPPNLITQSCLLPNRPTRGIRLPNPRPHGLTHPEPEPRHGANEDQRNK